MVLQIKGPVPTGLHIASRPHEAHRGPTLLFSVNFLSFLIASAGAFLPQNTMLYIGLDGEFTRLSTLQLFRFAKPGLGLPSAPFQALGTLYAYNPLLSPSSLPIAMLGDGGLGVWLSFMICAALLFVSAYVLGRALGMNRGVCLVAAWALPILSLPYQSWINLYLTFNLNPLGGDTVSFAMFGIALLARGYAKPYVYFAALGLTLVVVWLFLANPFWILLIIPTAIPIGIGITASHWRCPDFLYRAAWLLLPSITFIGLAGGPYLVGLFADTAASFFRTELTSTVAHSWRLCTVATAWGTGLDPIGASWVGLAVSGLALAIWRARGSVRVAALSVVATLVFLVGYCIAYFATVVWVLPMPIYFEFFLWPFYALFAAYAIAEAAAVVAMVAADIRYMLPFEIWLAGIGPAWWRYVGPPAAFGAVAGLTFVLHPFNVPGELYHRPVETPIAKILYDNSNIAPDTDFRGSVATLTGFGGPIAPPTDWLHLLSEANESFLKFGNTDRVPYLWRYNLATVEGYSQNIEPAMYAVTTRLLDRPGDGQLRSVTFVSRADLPLLQSLGVRYLITDFTIPPPARRVAQQVTPSLSHFAYELPDPNYGTYSPTVVVSARTAMDVLMRLADNKFDFRSTVILNGQIGRTLVLADDTRLTLVRGGWRVRAQSKATSLTLLPVQFSRCLTLSERHDGSGKVIGMERANLTSTALIFEGKIDVTLALEVSPFWAPYCRIRDAQEMRDFGVGEVPRTLALPPA
jgi:hypothetical protein